MRRRKPNGDLRYPCASAASTTVGIEMVAATTEELQNVLSTQHLHKYCQYQIVAKKKFRSVGLSLSKVAGDFHVQNPEAV